MNNDFGGLDNRDNEIVIKYLPQSGAILCYNESQPVTEEEITELDALLMRMHKVFAVSMGGIPEDNEKYAELQAENNAAADLDPNWPAHYE